jgi:hypothetical protein
MQPFPPDPLTSRFEFNSYVPQHSAQPTTLWRKRLFGSTGKYQNLPNLGSTTRKMYALFRTSSWPWLLPPESHRCTCPHPRQCCRWSCPNSLC